MRRSYLNGTNQKIPKHIEFIRKFPTYVSNGKITFPILDEYLLVFNGIFGDNYRKKPIPIYDSFIPQQYFPDILQIWDVYHNLSKLIERIRHYAPPDLGGFSHFNETKIHLSNFTREDIYKALRFGPHNENSQILYQFFISFYLKQFVEDNDFSEKKKPFWSLISYLWNRDRQSYFEIINIFLYQIPFLLLDFNLFQDHQTLFWKLKSSQTSQEQFGQILLILCDGLTELKRMPAILNFRIELMNIKQKEKLVYSENVRTLRGQMVQQNQKDEQVEEIEEKYREFISQYNRCNRELQFHKIHGLDLNSIYFLGYDAKNAEYFFCLHEPDKIFICYKDSYIDEDSETKWGYYNKFDELIDSLNCKGVKENILKNNIEELIREKLLQENVDSDSDDEEFELNVQCEKKQVENDLNLKEEFLKLEQQLSQSLKYRSARWIDPQNRYQFLQQVWNSNNLKDEINYFLENSYWMEKIKKAEYDIEISFSQDQTQINGNVDNQKWDIKEFTTFNYYHEEVIAKRIPLRLMGNTYEYLKQDIQSLLISDDPKYLQLIIYTLKALINEFINRKRIPNEKKQSNLEEDIIIKDSCQVCQLTGRLYRCNGCQVKFHLKCHKMKKSEDFKYYCQICIKASSQSVKTRQTMKLIQKQLLL